MPLVRHAFASIFWNGSKRSPQPTKSEYEIEASESSFTFETLIFLLIEALSKSSSNSSLFPELNLTKAPCPLAADQRLASAGALAIPTTTSSSPDVSTLTSAINVAQVGTPRIKFLVPSIGSITQ